MKDRTFSSWFLGVSVAILPLAGAQAESLASGTDEAARNQTDVLATNVSAPAVALAADTDATARLVSTDKPLPPNLRPSGPVAEVIKLANSGLDQSVLLAYVTNSTYTFNLSAEDIIYLNDIGVPGSVVTAMIQQDQVLKAELAAASGPGVAAPEPGPGWPAPGNEQPTSDQVGPQTAGSGPPASEPGPGYATEAPLAPPEDASVPMFYDSLSPYGNWVDIAGYGRCWQPSVMAADPGWQPYFDGGHWVYSDCGWYWLSDYSWGWAPFHYGSWFRHGRLGWCWVPGRVWGPSWVCWRYDNQYCGWAPLPPGAGFSSGVGLTFHGHGVWDRDDFGLRPNHYHFVAWNHFSDRQLRPSSLPPNQVARVFESATVSTRIIGDAHTVINNGLPPSRVVAATHRPVHTVALRERTSPATGPGRGERFEAGGQALAIYRPQPASLSRSSQEDIITVGAHKNASTSAGPAPWVPRTGVPRQSLTELRQDNPPPGTAAPLILHGPQTSALRESARGSSLVVIGRSNGARPSASATAASSSSPVPRAASAAPAPEARPAVPRNEEVARVQNSPNRSANSPFPQRNWMGMVDSSPRPSWFGGNNAGWARQNYDNAGAVPRTETPTYQAVPRSAAAQSAASQVPRYTSTPSYSPQRGYSAPAWSAPTPAPSYQARPAPSAPSAAPAASASRPAASAPAQSSSSNGRTR